MVDTDEKLAERVAFIHERVGTDAHGRAIYRGPRALCRRARQRAAARAAGLGARVRRHGARAASRIATAKVKHDLEYQERRGIESGPAKDLSPELRARIANIAKRICRTLELDGYSRIDFRLSTDGIPYFLEANPNPEIAKIEEFAEAAAKDGIKYRDLLNRIVTLAIQRADARRGC